MQPLRKPILPKEAMAFDPDMAGRIRRVFSSPDGAPILEMLSDYAFNDAVSDDDQPWRIIGRQDVVKYINQLFEEGKDG